MLKNFWYIAATSAEVAETPLARTILGTPLVVFRDSNGVAHALDDMCPHRRAPLSGGRVIGDAIECPYHGLLFDGKGRCTHIPTQQDIPGNLKTDAFALHEADGIIWIWPGNAEDADPALLPDLPWRQDPDWNATLVQHYAIAAPAGLISDNLLDLSHVAFIHSKTIGFNPEALKDDPLVTEFDGDRIINTRFFPDVPPAPTHKAWGGFTGNVDRTSRSEWTPPGRVTILVKNADKNTSLEIRFDHFVTPETDETHHYFVAISRNFQIDDEELTRTIDSENDKVHVEDKEIVEAQFRNIKAHGAGRDMAIRQDKALIRSHRILERLARDEAKAKAPVEA